MIHIDLLLCLYSCLPVMLLIIGLIGPQMKVDFAIGFPLLLQYLQSFFIWQVSFQILQTVSIRIAIQPLQEYNIIMKFAFAYFLKRQRLCNFQFFQCILNEFDISIIVLRIFSAKIQFEYIDRSWVYCVYHLGICDSVTEILDSGIFSLHQSINPFKQLVPSKVHFELYNEQTNYSITLNKNIDHHNSSQAATVSSSSSEGSTHLYSVCSLIHFIIPSASLSPLYSMGSTDLSFLQNLRVGNP